MPPLIKPTRILGPSGAPFNVLVVAEGFTSKTLSTFTTALRDKFVPLVKKEGWYKKANVSNMVAFWKCPLKSGNSGVPLAFAGGCPAVTLAMAATAPNVSFNTVFGIEGCQTVAGTSVSLSNWVKQVSAHYAAVGVPGFNVVIVLVNFPVAAGLTTGGVAWATLGTKLEEWALHELGHCFLLDDEYEPNATDPDSPVGAGATFEGYKHNVIGRNWVTSHGSTPWGFNAASLPPNKVDCTTVASVLGPVAAYEGAGNFHCRCYRPAPTCRMRKRSHKFCKICTDVIANSIDAAGVVNPIVV